MYAQDALLLKTADTIDDKYNNICPKVKDVRLVRNLIIVLSLYVLCTVSVWSVSWTETDEHCHNCFVNSVNFGI